jgi:hypothetical protein
VVKLTAPLLHTARPDPTGKQQSNKPQKFPIFYPTDLLLMKKEEQLIVTMLVYYTVHYIAIRFGFFEKQLQRNVENLKIITYNTKKVSYFV